MKCLLSGITSLCRHPTRTFHLDFAMFSNNRTSSNSASALTSFSFVRTGTTPASISPNVVGWVAHEVENSRLMHIFRQSGTASGDHCISKRGKDICRSVFKPHDDRAMPKRDGPHRLPERALDGASCPCFDPVKCIRYQTNTRGADLQQMSR
jgi:hypothetical protein